LISPINSEVKTLYFILSGTARHYFRNADNEEITIWISEAGGLSTDYGAFTRGVPTQYEIQAITDVAGVAIDSDNLNELYDRYKNFERLGRLINQQYLNDFIDRNNFLINNSAKERYRILLDQKPHWFNTIPLKHLASYLAVTVETLSRLRSNTY
jgi:CRP-like cAMP-binding protein